jgi:hypothetical protein
VISKRKKSILIQNRISLDSRGYSQIQQFNRQTEDIHTYTHTEERERETDRQTDRQRNERHKERQKKEINLK